MRNAIEFAPRKRWPYSIFGEPSARGFSPLRACAAISGGSELVSVWFGAVLVRVACARVRPSWFRLLA